MTAETIGANGRGLWRFYADFKRAWAAHVSATTDPAPSRAPRTALGLLGPWAPAPARPGADIRITYADGRTEDVTTGELERRWPGALVTRARGA